MVMSVVWSLLFGWLMLSSFVLMLPSMDEAAKQGWNVFFWAMDTQVNPTIKMALYVAIFISQFLCGLATVTSVSRMIFAFSRDGGLPCSKALASVSPNHRSPVAAIWTGATLAVLFVWGSSVISIGATPVYTIVVSCTVIFLFFSFIIPIVLGLFTYGTVEVADHGTVEHGARVVFIVRHSLDPLDGADLRHRHPAAERLGAVHHHRFSGSDGHRLVRL